MPCIVPTNQNRLCKLASQEIEHVKRPAMVVRLWILEGATFGAANPLHLPKCDFSSLLSFM